MQSSTEQQGSLFALTSAAVHWCCITAPLCEEQIFIGVIAVAQACSAAVEMMSTDRLLVGLERLFHVAKGLQGPALLHWVLVQQGQVPMVRSM